MSQEPLIVPTFAPRRSILLSASFAGCGMLLGVLFVVLMGCGTLLSLDGEVDDLSERGALRLPMRSSERPRRRSVEELHRSGSRRCEPGDKIDGNVIALGQNTVGLRFLKLGVPRFRRSRPRRSNSRQRVVQQERLPPDPHGGPAGRQAVRAAARQTSDGLPLIGGHVDWTVDPWNAQNDKPDFKPEQTPDLFPSSRSSSTMTNTRPTARWRSSSRPVRHTHRRARSSRAASIQPSSTSTTCRTRPRRTS